MIDFSTRFHPDVLFSYSSNHSDLILRVENSSAGVVWSEAEILVPEGISLSHDGKVHKGRIRIGIISNKEFIEKSVKIYASRMTPAQKYLCTVVLFGFDKDGIIKNRIEKQIDIKVEGKKEVMS
ncbi:MAG: hypothetical protein ACP5N9_05440 [Candidatus Bilamarchaeum sp.]